MSTSSSSDCSVVFAAFPAIFDSSVDCCGVDADSVLVRCSGGRIVTLYVPTVLLLA
ncbi:hypothetical protein HK405_006028, partial [Cladochytrium tenue]